MCIVQLPDICLRSGKPFLTGKTNKIYNKIKSTTQNKKSLTSCHVCKNWVLLRTTVLHSSSLKLQSLDSSYKILFFKVLQMSSIIKLYSVHNLRNGICINLKKSSATLQQLEFNWIIGLETEMEVALWQLISINRFRTWIKRTLLSTVGVESMKWNSQ